MKNTTKEKIRNILIKMIKILMVVTAIEIGAIIIVMVAKTNAKAFDKNTVEEIEENTTTIMNVTKADKILINDYGIDDDTVIIEIDKPLLEEQFASVFEWQIYGGDFGVEQLHYLNNQCQKYDIPMEIMLSLICTESSFRSDAQATTSSAAGYCQILKGTAEWIYEDKLHYGQYNTENHTEIMTTDWRLNIEISCRLLYNLYYNNGTWENAIKRYYGGSDEANEKYLSKINKNMLDLFGMTIENFN